MRKQMRMRLESDENRWDGDEEAMRKRWESDEKANENAIRKRLEAVG
jgi:hypothetical protein